MTNDDVGEGRDGNRGVPNGRKSSRMFLKDDNASWFQRDACNMAPQGNAEVRRAVSLLGCPPTD